MSFPEATNSRKFVSKNYPHLLGSRILWIYEQTDIHVSGILTYLYHLEFPTTKKAI